MSEPTRINGTDLIIEVAGTAVSHTTSASLSLEMATIDVSSKDDSGNQTVIGGQKSSSIDFEGMTDFSATYGVADLYSVLDGRTEVNWTLGVSGGASFSGKGLLTNLSVDAPMEDASTFSGTITVTEGVSYSSGA